MLSHGIALCLISYRLALTYMLGYLYYIVLYRMKREASASFQIFHPVIRSVQPMLDSVGWHKKCFHRNVVFNCYRHYHYNNTLLYYSIIVSVFLNRQISRFCIQSSPCVSFFV